MERYRGRVKVSKIDHKGKIIRGSLAIWKRKNPGKEYFDSKIEYEVSKWLKKNKTLKYETKKTLTLYDPIKTLEFVKGKIKSRTVRSISYTPDFYLPEYDIYIEVKGYADPLFKLRWKLFKFAGYTGFIVYTINELEQLIKEIKLYFKK